MALESSIGIFSEVGRLRKVFVHSPGPEVESVTPKTAQELLFNDIIHVADTRREHAQLKQVLSAWCEVFEVKECLKDILEMPDSRLRLLRRLTNYQGYPELLPDLMQLPSEDLANQMICGIPLQRNSFQTYLSPKNFAIVPLPNMYFMRDSSVVVGNRVINSAMAFPVRYAEALIMRSLFRYHPKLKGHGSLLDVVEFSDQPKFSIEGGDVLVFQEDCILIGISERTTASAVDAFVDALIRTRKKDHIQPRPFDVIAVLLPQERSTIHLDMIFSFASKEQAIVYEPYVMGRDRARVIHMHIGKDSEKKIVEENDLLSCLKKCGYKIEPILCGGKNPLQQQREQWGSGANVFALAPGKILSYDMHENTVNELIKNGFQKVSANEIVENPQLLQMDKSQVITLEGNELARGGGGPRCMTCPVLRDPL